MKHMFDTRKTITIWKKELKDNIRDRRTLMSMLIMPVVLMPLLTIGMFKLLDKVAEDQRQQTVKIAISGEQNSPELANLIKGQEKLEVASADGSFEIDVKDGKIDAAVEIPENFRSDIENQRPVNVGLVIKSTNTRSANAGIKVSSAIEAFNSQILQQRFNKLGVKEEILSKVALETKDTATEKETGGFVLGLLIPMFIVMWSIVGGQYTAIDVSAGEKERKTLESLLLTPAKKTEIVLGKFLAVSTAALVSVIAAIGSFYFVLIYAGGFGPVTGGTGMNLSQNTGNVPVNFSVDPQALLLLFIVSLFLVLMFSAVILSIAIFAKSFKEAQSYIGPSYILIILPTVLANSIPGFEPALWFFAVPAVNAILLFKEVLMGVYDASHISLTIASLAVYSAAALHIAVKIYSKENVLFKD